MSRWAGFDQEMEGIRQAADNKNLDNDALAAYVYDRMAEYNGDNHPAVCRLILLELIVELCGGR